MSSDLEAPGLTACGCCEGGIHQPERSNPPGQSVLRYRVGTHSQLLRRLIARLPRFELPDGDHAGRRPLEELTTRASDDPAIALLDAWSTVGDVLTFYQERIANEGFLRSATERRSVLELARAIGYELDPGVAASVYLVFEVDEADGTPDTATVSAGTQVQSVPASDGELPQTFETGEDFEARVEWNELRARTSDPQVIGRGLDELYLKGANTRLEPGDPILLVGETRAERWRGSERWDFRFVKTVETVTPVDPELEPYTRVTWEPGLGHERPTVDPAEDAKAYGLRRRAALFGHNAPDFRAMPDSIKEAFGNPRGRQWPDFENQTTRENTVDLDAVYEKIVVGSWVVLMKPTYVELYKVEEATVDSRTDYTLTAQVTRLRFDTREHLSWFPLRDTAVYAESEELERTGRARTDPVEGLTIELDGTVEGLETGHVLVVCGVPVGREDEVSEVAFLDTALEVTRSGQKFTRLVLQAELANRFERSSVRVRANVVHATHGETVSDEALGGGDGSQTHQRFELRRSPLTYVSAATASGSASTLSVRVDGVEWTQEKGLFGLAADARAYTARIDDDAKTTSVFGDGERGARLPTGQENVVADYRFGLGEDGNVGAGSLILLKKRPFGVKGVDNPVEASGGENPEKLADARQNAPVTVLTLDRIVSLRDFEDFARTFSGIGKAGAAALQVGQTQLVHLTIAATDGSEVDPASSLYTNLFDAIEGARDPLLEVRLASFELRSFRLAADVLIDPAYEWEAVKAEIESALRDAFSFGQRAFGQTVSSAEVLEVMHRAAGVTAVDLNQLQRLEDGAPVGDPLAPVLPAFPARLREPGSTEILPAELLLLEDGGIALTELKT